MNEKRIALTGATGMIGGIVLRHALSDSNVGSVVSIGRRATGLEHPKLQEIQHADFTDFGPITDGMRNCDAAFFCLGAYTGAVSDEELRSITVDYTVAFSKALFSASPDAAFCLLSGQGADQTEKSRVSFSRYKGMAENALLAQGFPRVHLFRPGYIYPATPRDEPNLTYRIFRSAYPLVRRIYPNIGISSEDLARVIYRVGMNGTPGHSSPVLENRDIRNLAAEAM